VKEIKVADPIVIDNMVKKCEILSAMIYSLIKVRAKTINYNP